MGHKHALIAELKMEADSTRRMLERVPTDKNSWKPHAKSMSLGQLANHVAELPGWIAFTLNAEELDFAKSNYKPEIPTSTEELLAKHDKNVNAAMEALENSSEENFEKDWTLRNGEIVIFTMPKKVVARRLCYSHQIHHRGQLSVYLRLLNVPIPGMYGPSADEMPAPVETASAN